jgi:hypothetical protein
LIPAFNLSFKRDSMLKTLRLNSATDLFQLAGEFLIGQGKDRPRGRQKERWHNDE